MLDPTGLYWTNVGFTNTTNFVPELQAFRQFGLTHHVSDRIQFWMFSPSSQGWSVARGQPKVLLALLLALPCNGNPSTPSGAELLAQLPPLPSRHESGTSCQLQVTAGVKTRGDHLDWVPLSHSLRSSGYITEYKSRWREKSGKGEFEETGDEEIHKNTFAKVGRDLGISSILLPFLFFQGLTLSSIICKYWKTDVHHRWNRTKSPPPFIVPSLCYI